MEADPEPTARLRLALQDARHPWASMRLHLLTDKGLAHHHVRLEGTGALARIPKQSQMGLTAADNLAYQLACFERAAAGGTTPRLLGCLPASTHLPRGALLVQEIRGRPARLPGDLPAMARSLAAIHALPVPGAQDRPPLLDTADPLLALAQEIGGQAAHEAAVSIGSHASRALQGGLASLRQWCADGPRPDRRLIAFDAHPGNFIVDASGRAVLVDLEKCRYSYPGLDLAHATLYTSTTWDIDVRCTLSPGQVSGFYAAWATGVGEPIAGAAARWHLPLRRAMWLWSLSWCVKYLAVSGIAAGEAADGEDWSAGRSDAALVRHVRERVHHYLSAEAVGRVLHEFDALGKAGLDA